MVETAVNILLPPPRTTGADKDDQFLQTRWMADFYEYFVRNLNVPGRMVDVSTLQQQVAALFVTLNDIGLLGSGSLDSGVVLQLRVVNNAGNNIVNLSLGPADSGGAGFRLLRVPN